MKEITAYKSESGLVSENKTEVEEDEAEFLFNKKVQEFVGDTCWNSMSISDVHNMMIENKKRLQEIFSE
jgi:hypothetical protein